MRKIEEKMVDAIRARRSINLGNSSVEVVGDKAKVYLHGNHIMTWSYKAKDFTMTSDCGWATVTTQSRMNGLFYGMGISKSYVIKGFKKPWREAYGAVISHRELPLSDKQLFERIWPADELKRYRQKIKEWKAEKAFRAA